MAVPAMSNSSRASLSVIIPAYNSQYLNQVLGSLKALESAEVIVVDSSLRPFILNGVRATLVRHDGRLSPGAARNRGAQRASGDYLLFVDSDVVLPPQTVDWIRRFLERPSAELVSGVYDAETLNDDFLSRLQNSILHYRSTGCLDSESRLFSSSHFLIQRKVFQRIGGFNEELWSYEDIEFLGRCLHLGHKSLMNPDFVGIHLKAFTLRTFLLDYFRKAYNAFLARRHYSNVFRGVPFYVGARLALTWLAGVLLPLVVAAAWLWGAFWPAGLLVPLCVYLALSSILLNQMLQRKSLAFRLKALLVLPLIGSVAATATAVAVSVWLFRSIRKALVFFWDLLRAAKRVLIRNGMPIQVIAYVTARCNLRCEHCFYKETLDAPSPGELPLDVFNRTTRGIGPVLWFSLGGGEPFIRKDLDKVIEIIQRNCRPKVFSFPTNGWYTEKTFETTLRVLQKMDEGNLILFFSLDGPREIHDQIRGPGSFDRVKATMERLRPLTALYPNLYLNVITTVTARNAHVAPAFIEELIRDFQPSAISINLFRYHSLEHLPIPDHVIEGYRAAVAVYERYLRGGALKHYGFFGGRVLLFKEILQKDLIYRVAKHNEFVTPCTAGTLSYVIMEDGRVSPCEILPDTIGNVTDVSRSFAEMTRSTKARKLRRWIRDTHCKCTYECAMSTNTLFSWPMSKRLAKAVVRDFISQSHGSARR